MSICRRSANVAAVFVLALAAAAPALTKDKDSPRRLSPFVSALEQCRSVTDSTQRLACFDGASAKLVAAASTGDVTIIDRAELREARRSLFGFNMPKLPLFGGDRSAEDDKDELETTVTSVQPGADNTGRYRIKLAEGGSWETTEAYMNFEPPHRGSKVKILRGPLGSYFVRIDGQRGVRGHRVQ